jgi:hypothetical protein
MVATRVTAVSRRGAGGMLWPETGVFAPVGKVDTLELRALIGVSVWPPGVAPVGPTHGVAP